MAGLQSKLNSEWLFAYDNVEEVPRQHGGGQQRRRENELDGGPGVMCALQQPTELTGDRVYRAYVLLSVKRIREGDGINFLKTKLVQTLSYLKFHHG